jgi:hypothetical protein
MLEAKMAHFSCRLSSRDCAMMNLNPAKSPENWIDKCQKSSDFTSSSARELGRCLDETIHDFEEFPSVDCYVSTDADTTKENKYGGPISKRGKHFQD